MALLFVVGYQRAEAPVMIPKQPEMSPRAPVFSPYQTHPGVVPQGAAVVGHADTCSKVGATCTKDGITTHIDDAGDLHCTCPGSPGLEKESYNKHMGGWGTCAIGDEAKCCSNLCSRKKRDQERMHIVPTTQAHTIDARPLPVAQAPVPGGQQATAVQQVHPVPEHTVEAKKNEPH